MMDLFLTMVNMATPTDGFCANTANIWQLVGYALLVFKIVIPIILIVMGMLDLGKAVVASKADEVKKATTSLALRAVAVVVIFLIPTIISFLIGIIGGFTQEAKDDYKICSSCITNPNSGCQKADELWNK